MFLSEWRVPDPCDSKFGIRRQGGFVVVDIYIYIYACVCSFLFFFELIVDCKLKCVYK